MKRYLNGVLQRLQRTRRWPAPLPVILWALTLYSVVAVKAQEGILNTSHSGSAPSVDEEPSGQPAQQELPTTPQGHSDKSHRGSIVVVPIPTVSPAIGNGVTLMGGYIFPISKKDDVSPPSVIGGVWLGTDNETRAWATGTELYFNRDRYHVVAGFAHGDLNYDFYGTGTIAGDAGRKFGLTQTGDIVFGEGLRRTFWQIFIGPRVWFGTSRLTPQHFSENHPDLPPLGVDFDMRSVGFKIERDTIPNRFYPDGGTLFRFGADFFSKELGGTFTFQRYRLTFNGYHSFDKKQVLAYNIFGCSTGGDAPFFGECIFGLQGELRGYPAGQYIDEKMLATQVEYRLALPWRLGLSAFGGLGEVAPTFSAFRARDVLPSGGFGPRFKLSTKYHVNLRADIAWGKNGHTFSMGIGESF
jgi:hypothetical protein